jgi:thiol peroxidase
MKIVGTEHPVRGPMLAIGQPAPDFRLITPYWAHKTLADYAGKVVIISVVPSLDTHVCSAQTRRFNQEAAALGPEVVILTVSADLPYAQGRWCGAEGIEAVVPLSDHFDMSFSDAYGVHVYSARIAQRAVFVLDRDGRVSLAEYVDDIDHEVDFDAALNTARALVGR